MDITQNDTDTMIRGDYAKQLENISVSNINICPVIFCESSTAHSGDVSHLIAILDFISEFQQFKTCYFANLYKSCSELQMRLLSA